MKARHWAFSGLAVGSLLFAGFIAEGQVEKNSGKRTENLTHSVPSAAAVRPVEVQPHVQKVLAADIGTRVQIIGRLGYPSGEMVTVQGSWVAPKGLPKDDSPSFIVTMVNGKRLAKPVAFLRGDFGPSLHGQDHEIPEVVGQVWNLRGCELGGYFGVPAPVLGDVRVDGEQWIPQQARRFGFYTTFVYSSSEPLEPHK